MTKSLRGRVRGFVSAVSCLGAAAGLGVTPRYVRVFAAASFGETALAAGVAGIGT